MTEDPFQPPPPHPYATDGSVPPLPSTPEERTTGLFLHLSQFLGYIVPLGGIIAPIVIWQMKKEQSPYLDWHGKEAVNFQITILIVVCAATLLALATCGFGAVLAVPAVVAIGAGTIVCIIIAAIRANEGKCWRYPFTIRLVK